jgi:antitoxin HigA-1
MAMKHPPLLGLSVCHDCLENPSRPGGLSVTAAAKLGIGRKQMPGKRIFGIVNGKSGISAEMAIRLDKAFGLGADTWYRLQAAYDLAQAMKRADRIKVARIANRLYTRGGIFALSSRR